MYKMRVKKFSILAPSPDMNPTENKFNYVRTKLHEESLNGNITFENFEEYSARVKKNLLPVPVKHISKTIELMDNRLSMVVKKGIDRLLEKTCSCLLMLYLHENFNDLDFET